MPIRVAEEEIGAVRSIVRSGLAAHPWPFLRAGSKIYIEHGPLRGLEGIITKAKKVNLLVISVTLLQRSVAVEIDADWARPISNPITVTS